MFFLWCSWQLHIFLWVSFSLIMQDFIQTSLALMLNYEVFVNGYWVFLQTGKLCESPAMNSQRTKLQDSCFFCSLQLPKTILASGNYGWWSLGQTTWKMWRVTKKGKVPMTWREWNVLFFLWLLAFKKMPPLPQIWPTGLVSHLSHLSQPVSTCYVCEQFLFYLSTDLKMSGSSCV